MTEEQVHQEAAIKKARKSPPKPGRMPERPREVPRRAAGILGEPEEDPVAALQQRVSEVKARVRTIKERLRTVNERVRGGHRSRS